MAALLPLPPGQIDLWLSFYDEASDPALAPRMLALLSEAERAQQLRFHFADDRLRYLVTRALVRTVLSRYAPLAPQAWAFSANAQGRPAIANVHPDLHGLDFNLSHTRGLIALAVSRHRRLGVDVENIAVREVSLGIADRFFAPAEVAALAAMPRERQQDRFFEYWTFKESYIKARGMGLSIPLEQFGFELPDAGSVRLAIDPALNDDARRWGLLQCRPGEGYLLALCVERQSDWPGDWPGDWPPALIVRKAVPTRQEDLISVDWLRVSDA